MMGVIAMIVLVIVLVALVPLLVWAAMVDRKRRRRGFAPVDVETRAQVLKASAEGKGTEGGAGSY
jgi:hypothetical protein